MSPSPRGWPLERQAIPDDQVRDAAEQFDNGRRMLLAQGPGSGVLLALLNCAAMALELFLKSLCARTVHVDAGSQEIPGLYRVYAQAERTPRHSLRSVFENIPEEIRQKLGEDFTSSCDGNDRALVSVLDDYEGLLEASRYPFEPNQKIDRFAFGPLMDLCDFIRAFVASLEPTIRILSNTPPDTD